MLSKYRQYVLRFSRPEVETLGIGHIIKKVYIGTPTPRASKRVQGLVRENNTM